MPKISKKIIMETTKNELLLSFFSFLNEKNILDNQNTDILSGPYFSNEDTQVYIFQIKMK